jgi:uncharacterized protein YggT (Ycf19 family)
MAQRIVCEETTETTSEHPARSSGVYTLANLIYLLFGLLEAVLILRLLFELLAANAANGFVNFIYSLSGPFVAPFYGIFGQPAANGSVLDTATIVAIVIYAIVAWALVRVVGIITNRPVDSV